MVGWMVWIGSYLCRGECLAAPDQQPLAGRTAESQDLQRRSDRSDTHPLAKHFGGRTRFGGGGAKSLVNLFGSQDFGGGAPSPPPATPLREGPRLHLNQGDEREAEEDAPTPADVPHRALRCQRLHLADPHLLQPCEIQVYHTVL